MHHHESVAASRWNPGAFSLTTGGLRSCRTRQAPLSNTNSYFVHVAKQVSSCDQGFPEPFCCALSNATDARRHFKGFLRALVIGQRCGDAACAKDREKGNDRHKDNTCQQPCSSHTSSLHGLSCAAWFSRPACLSSTPFPGPSPLLKWLSQTTLVPMWQVLRTSACSLSHALDPFGTPTDARHPGKRGWRFRPSSARLKNQRSPPVPSESSIDRSFLFLSRAITKT